MHCLLLLNAFAIMASGAHAVLSGEGQRGAGGYRYNGPAHKYLPPAVPPSVEPAEVITSPSSAAANGGYKYQEPAKHYLPATTSTESPNQLPNYGFNSPVPTTQRPSAAAYNNGYNNLHYYQQIQKLTPIAANYDRDYQQHTQPQQDREQTSYYVPKSPVAASIQDQRESYYVPSAPHRDYFYNKYNNNYNNAGYRYNTPQPVELSSSGYGYERPTAIDNEQYYGTPVKEIISYQQFDNNYSNHKNFQTTGSTSTPFGATSANPAGADVAQTFGISANAPVAANFHGYDSNDLTQTSLAQAAQYNGYNYEKQQQQEQRITTGSNDYLQMQSNSYERPAFHGHGQRMLPQQQSAQDSYFPQSKPNAYAPPSLEFQPPYY